MQSAEKWPDNTAYSYYGHKVTYKNFVKKIEKTAIKGGRGKGAIPLADGV
jgi:hypothetical protein